MASLPELQPPEIFQPRLIWAAPWFIHFNKWPLYPIYGLQKVSSLDLHELLHSAFISTNGLFTWSTASKSSPASTYMSFSWPIHFSKWPLYLIYRLQKFSSLGLQETFLGPSIPTNGLFTLSTASRSSPASASSRHSLVRASPQMASTTASQRSFASSRLALLNL